MSKQILLLSSLFYFLLTPVYGQYQGGIALEDGNYQGVRFVNQEPQTSITFIEQISLGNGIQVYKNAQDQSNIDGLFYLNLGSGGSLKGALNFSKGLLNGTSLVYYRDNLVREINYNMGVLDQQAKEYFDNGQLKSISTYNSGALKSTISYHDNSQIEKEIFYNEQGLKNGEVIIYNPQGKEIDKSVYKDGALQGKSVRTLQDGLKVVANYDNDVLQGKYQEFYSNGELKVSGRFDSNGKYTSKWTQYNQDGSIQSVSNYNNGELDGVSITYFSKDKVQYYMEFKQGEFHGKNQEYQQEPYVLIKEAHFENGVPHGEYKAYQDGLIWRESIYKEGNIVMEKQYLNGKVSSLRMLDESGNLVDVHKYDAQGKSTFTNKNYKKNMDVLLVEDQYGIISIEN